MMHQKKIYSRLLRVSRAKMYGYLSRKGLVQTDMSKADVTIILGNRTGLVNIDAVIPSVIQQLKKDIGICQSIIVVEEDWSSFSFMESVRAVLKKELQRIASKHVSKDEWDSWQHLEELKEDWAWPSPDDIPWDFSGPPIDGVSPPDVQRDGGLMDNHTKDCLELLKIHRPQKLTVGRDSLIRLRSSEPILEKEGQEPPFELWEIDGTPLRQSIFQTAGYKDQVSSTHLSGTRKDPSQKISAMPAGKKTSEKDPVWSTDHFETREYPGQKTAITSADTATTLDCKQDASPIDGTCPRCEVSMSGLADKKGIKRHQQNCRGKCERCRDLKLPCDSRRGASCSNCTTTGAKCGGPVTHVDLVVTSGTCGRCNTNVRKKDSHQQHCPGKCEACKDRNVPCDCFMHYGESPSCSNCKQEQLNCTGPITHAHLVLDHVGTCERCKTKFQNAQKHQQKCRGKCERCQERGIPCDSSTRTSKFHCCTNCQLERLECTGPISHAHLFPENNQTSTCPRCGTIPEVANFAEHQRMCQGKCKHCKELDLPCDYNLRGKKPRCANCEQANIDCSGPITHAQERTCQWCGMIPKNANFGAHESKCRGKCKHCKELYIPCDYRGKRIKPCANCKQANIDCSGPSRVP
jgi:hypothetical protein